MLIDTFTAGLFAILPEILKTSDRFLFSHEHFGD